ncbi:inter-alpha-trypsin inhibitor heavy chain H3-like isoform X2 [Simochromis diagramma]|uniref:inter-alpha-trypsin inhibitor heavy chain H3-like isoform X2 n=1 Tax=Simochromis diagramma TaxID=43689 RepID=UPI001A7E5E11|nr:inter-alpha-trypsin inhibitor heavy chain H3-like isoform X2 [Simochromis diagramma]
MERSVVQITLFGLLLSLASTLPNKDDWDIYSFHINSTVTSRYATTVITSRVANRMNESKEIEFHVRIPKNAFISKFRMFIDGQVYDGVVKAKEQAQQQYSEAVSRGESAGLVSSVGRTLEEFKTSVTVAAHKKVTFELTYEELMKRTRGKYELQIHARPMQPVSDFKVDVHIQEEAGFSFIDVKGGLSTKALANAITKTHTDKEAWVYFYPTVDQQKMCDSCSDQGMNGDLVIVYDVNRDNGLGHIKKSDGYFVHHFAPSDLPRVPKNVVFVIDQSGSMSGRKILQTRTALIHILNDLAEDDHFGLITFDGNILHWKRELVQANGKNLESAKNFASNIQARGSTDINEAVLQGARMLNDHSREGSASILILLTDGDPTSGVTNLENIQSNVRQAIAGKFPLYCLGFGFDVDFKFLEKMSLQNNGVARRIYEDSDADLQLKGFYEEVATPLLTDVTMIYVGGTNLTQTNFSQYYNGSEIVVAGEITDNNIETFTPQVVAISSNRRIIFSNPNETVESTGTVSDDRIQRVWAYLTVKQLLDKELQLSGPEKEKVKKEALELSLKYSFVTPLTSMVVTKPPGENTDVLHKPKEGETPQRWQSRVDQSFSIQYLAPSSRRSSGGVTYGYPVLRPFSRQLNHHSHLASVTDVMEKQSIGGYGGYSLSGISNTRGVQGKLRGKNIGRQVVLPDVQPAVVHLSRDTTTLEATDVPVLHRFLLKAENQTVPLCFDVSGPVRLKLLHYPSRELSVNGELDSVTNGGFSRIFIHVKDSQHVEIDTNWVTVRDGQTVTYYTGQDRITAGSVTVIVRNNEIDVATGDMRMVIIVHENNGPKFLWPVLRQRPSDNNAEGLLAVEAAVYEEVQQAPVRKLKIKNQEADVTGEMVVDYSFASPVSMNCWLMSADSALQRPLSQFVITQL